MNRIIAFTRIMCRFFHNSFNFRSVYVINKGKANWSVIKWNEKPKRQLKWEFVRLNGWNVSLDTSATAWLNDMTGDDSTNFETWFGLGNCWLNIWGFSLINTSSKIIHYRRILVASGLMVDLFSKEKRDWIIIIIPSNREWDKL